MIRDRRCRDTNFDAKGDIFGVERDTIHGDGGLVEGLPGDDEPDAGPRKRRQPRHERYPLGLAETPGGSGDEGLAGGDAGDLGSYCPFAIGKQLLRTPTMSVAQVTQEISQMTEDEQFDVAAFLQHLVEERDPNHAAAMAAANRRMDEGQKVSFEELAERHEALERQGE